MADDRAKVVVGYDRAAGGREALALGCNLAREYDCDLLAVNVRRHVRSLTRPPVVDYMVALEVAEQVRAMDPGMCVDTRLVEASDPAEALGEVAARTPARALVIGTSRRHVPGRLHPPGVTRRVIEGLPCSVAVAPPGYHHGAGHLAAEEIQELTIAGPTGPSEEWAATAAAAPTPAGATFPA